MTPVETIPYADFVRALAKPGADILATLTPERTHLLHMAIGICGEAGELLEGVLAAGNATDARDNVIEELGDFEFYLEGMRQGLAIDRETRGAAYNMVIMSLDELQSISTLGLQYDHLCGEAIRLVVEASTLLDLTKKGVVYNKLIEAGQFEAVLEKIEGHLSNIRALVLAERDQVIATNKAKLAIRYAGITYSDAAAHARADKEPGS